MSSAASAEPVPAEQGVAAAGRGGGLGAITVATVVAGVIGYLLLAAAPKVLEPEHYLEFNKFWSGLYLLVAALSGLQQEVTRATHPAGASAVSRSAADAPGGRPRLWLFALVSGLAAAGLVAASSPLWASYVFPERTPILVAALAVALASYAGVAVLSGVFFGLKLWPAVAGMTIADAVLRLGLVSAALFAGHDLGVIAWAVALPFPLSLALLWALTRRRVSGRYAVDVPPARLASNALKTLGGATALGILTSGLPLLVAVAPASEPTTAIAAVVFVITLTRAPLVIPILALQGWLTVFFRDRAASQPRPLALVAGGVLAVSIVAAVVAFFVEPWLLHAIWGDRYQVDGLTCAGIVVTAGLMAALCVTGPATLAAGRHGAYLAGWALAAALTVATLFTPLPLIPRTLLAMALGPLVGMMAHVTALLRPPGAAEPAPATP